VRYQVRAQRVPGASYDVAGGASFGLFRADGSFVTSLRGGYGTTGEEVVFALPLRDIGLARGGRIDAASAFTGTGSYDTGATTFVDRVTLTSTGSSR
jgi:hypothetical protein